MADFLISNDVNAVEVDSRLITIHGKLPEDAVVEAVSKYNAVEITPEWE